MKRSKVIPRYALWNNKGGVGKTFLSFIIAAAYAEKHPDQSVVVVDMCPQANVSEIILGGNGAGAEQLNSLLQKEPRKSIGGYFDLRINQPHTKVGSEASFTVHAADINHNMPTNLYLVAGDPSLEVQTQAINQISGQALPSGAWGNVHRWLDDLVDEIAIKMPNAVFFIDCNPSFSAYTEIALLAANRIIVPCTADGSSARAIDNISQLLYGIDLPPAYSNASFSQQANKHRLTLPSIHLVPLNRSTQWDKKASKAFKAMYGEIQGRVQKLRNAMPQYFSLSKEPFIDIPDAHSVAIVAAHKGVPLSSVRLGSHNVHGTKCQVNREPLKRYRAAVKKLVELL
jgi:cellulose biosynthesis protein BcsQ